MGRICFPYAFGMWTLRTGGARYMPVFARSSERVLFEDFARIPRRSFRPRPWRRPSAFGDMPPQPVGVDVMGQRRERHRGGIPRQLRYRSAKFVEMSADSMSRSSRSSRRFHVPAPTPLLAESLGFGSPLRHAPYCGAPDLLMPLARLSLAATFTPSVIVNGLLARRHEISRVPGRPLFVRRALQTPVEPAALGLELDVSLDVQVLSSPLKTTPTSNHVPGISGLNPTAREPAVYAS